MRGNYITGACALLATLALAVSLAACGDEGGEPSPAAATGTYRAEVVEASFPTRQSLGETSLLRLAIRNTGERAIPALAVSISIAGREGRESALPFGFRDPQPGLAQPDRPIWVLAEGYPKRAGDPAPGGAETASPGTFNLGRLEPGETTTWVWKVSAVESGRHTVLYKVGAGLTGEARAETAAGVAPGGSFRVRIATAPPNTIVTGDGEVVQIPGRHEAERAGGGGN